MNYCLRVKYSIPEFRSLNAFETLSSLKRTVATNILIEHQSRARNSVPRRYIFNLISILEALKIIQYVWCTVCPLQMCLVCRV